jgi:excisionase family DNA binding protein
MDKSIHDYRDLLNVDEVAEICRVHRSTIYKLIKSGKIHAIKLGREFRVPKIYIIENILRMKTV